MSREISLESDEWSQMLCEYFLHSIQQILYIFEVYPRETFQKSYFLQTEGRKSKITLVRNYLLELGVALQNLIQHRVIREFHLLLSPQNSLSPIHRFTFRIHDSAHPSTPIPMASLQPSLTTSLLHLQEAAKNLSSQTKNLVLKNEALPFQWSPECTLHEENFAKLKISDRESLLLHTQYFWHPMDSSNPVKTSLPQSKAENQLFSVRGRDYSHQILTAYSESYN